MRILLTNDDGIRSPGLAAVSEALSRDHEVWTIAPAVQQSAVSHSITIHEPVRTRETGPREFTCRGTPVDCVIISLDRLLPDPPDVVVSGINIGPNLGSDTIFSGTAAAARQAAFRGIPALAVSLNAFTPPLHLAPAAEFVRLNLAGLVSLWTPDHYININIPNSEKGWGGVLVGEPCRPEYENLLRHFEAPNGEQYHFYHGQMKQERGAGRGAGSGEGRTDLDVILEGNISVSPICLDPVLSAAARSYGAHSFVVRPESD